MQSWNLTRTALDELGLSPEQQFHILQVRIFTKIGSNFKPRAPLNAGEAACLSHGAVVVVIVDAEEGAPHGKI